MADWPQWRGPSRNGISAEKGLLSTWSGSGPRRVWTQRIGQGFSSVAVKGNLVYTVGNYNGEDYISAIGATTGKVAWQHRYKCEAGDYAGPRATPVVHEGNVYTMSREGVAFCLNAATGKVVWQKDLAGDAQRPQWGFAGSPLIQGGLVLYNIGAAGVAADKKTGRVVWKSGGGPAGYSSPTPFTAGGQTGVAIFAGTALLGLNPTTGKEMWEYPWQTSYDVNAADPIFSGDSVFISSNYGKGGALLRLAGGRPTLVWENRNMKNHFNTCVLLNGSLYGNDENTLKCIDWRTGDEKWRMRGMDKGGLIAADGKIIALTGRGELVLASATPGAFNELARAKVLDGTCWTHPVLANGLLYCRSQEGNLVCLDMKGKA
jgi:outer membrane protein assembly factor BamB